jgi:hypothetical protein
MQKITSHDDKLMKVSDEEWTSKFMEAGRWKPWLIGYQMWS